jgi:tryptophanyl-tRNA synthetase
MAEKKRLFTGLQPSGQLHLGNYFGALKPTVELCREHAGLVMVADYHALTTLKNPADLKQNIFSLAKDYLAAGLDPQQTILFKQSDVPEHTELAWIFETLVTVPFLERAHAYKDKVAKGLEANAGLFNYPMLMAADILLYDTEVVPVGEDQRQHVEYAREAAAKFNIAYGQTFTEPAEKILAGIGVVPGTDGKKMSKSYGNTVPLFGSFLEIKEAVMSIVTDSTGERPSNVYAIHRLFRSDTELESLYESNKGNYKTLKQTLAEDIEKVISPMRANRDAISDEEVRKVLMEGGEKARALASAKMKEVRTKVGVSL